MLFSMSSSVVTDDVLNELAHPIKKSPDKFLGLKLLGATSLEGGRRFESPFVWSLVSVDEKSSLDNLVSQFKDKNNSDYLFLRTAGCSTREI